MKKAFIIFAAITFLVLISPDQAFAHPGNTDSSGCHTCRTNCSSWGLSYGEYHCHNSKGISQPSYPIRSHYGAGGTGYTEPWPDYTIGGSGSYYSIPDCPFHSSYDYLSEKCECNYGYVADGGKCVTEDAWCQDIYGYNSEYDVLSDGCKCKRGYIASDSGLSCISGNSYCYSNYGYNSSYNSFSKTCECDYGYSIGSSGQCEKESKSSSNVSYDYYELLRSYQAQKSQNYSENSIDNSNSINTNANPNALNIGRNLFKGMDNSDVRSLQIYLAQDPSVYPEGITSGYFGSLTEKAVRKFQKKHGLAQTGIFDVQTRNKIKSFNGNNTKNSQTSNVTKKSSNNPATLNTQKCINHYGLNIRWNGTYSDNGAIVCDCDYGYKWNAERTGCVSNDYTPTVNNSASMTGKEYYRENGTCIGLSGDLFGECLNYAYNQ